MQAHRIGRHIILKHCSKAVAAGFSNLKQAIFSAFFDGPAKRDSEIFERAKK